MDSGRISGTGFLARENSRRRRRKMSAVFSGGCSTRWDYLTFRIIKMNIILKVQCIHYVINKNWMMKVTFGEQVMYLIKANFLQRVAKVTRNSCERSYNLGNLCTPHLKRCTWQSRDAILVWVSHGEERISRLDCCVFLVLLPCCIFSSYTRRGLELRESQRKRVYVLVALWSSHHSISAPFETAHHVATRRPWWFVYGIRKFRRTWSTNREPYAAKHNLAASR